MIVRRSGPTDPQAAASFCFNPGVSCGRKINAVVSTLVFAALLLTSLAAADDDVDRGPEGSTEGYSPELRAAVRESVRLATRTPLRDVGDGVKSSSGVTAAAGTIATAATATTITTTTTTTTTTPTTTTTKSPMKTLGPSTDVEYKMVLSSSGPAVLDSAVRFYVELIPQVQNASIANWTTQFIYQWMNMANKAMNRTEDERLSRITMTFFSKKVKAGNYPMTVAAFLKDNPTRLVAFQTQIFVLTERLNGQLVLYQDLPYQRYPNVFATNKKLSLRAQVNDRFHKSPKPTFEYFWYKGGKFITRSKQPTIETRVHEPTNITVTSKICLSFNDGVWDGFLPNCRQKELKKMATGSTDSQLPEEQVYSEMEPLDQSDIAVTEKPRLIDSNSDNLPLKTGNFDAPAAFKDELTSCTLERTDKKGFAIEAKTSAMVTVSCLGSPPVAICLNVTKQNHTIDPAKACLPVDFLNDTTHKVRVFLNTSGWQDVHFFVYNDVSRVSVVESFYGYTQDSSSILPLTLPVVFGLLGLTVILIGGAYVMRLRKKPLVEVADFDFHPVLTSRLRDSNSITLSRMFNSLRYFLFARDKSGKDEIDFPAELSPTPTEFSPTPTDFSRTPLSESFKSETEHVLYGSL